MAIRGSGIQVASASSYTIAWPAGTLAGDLAIIFVSNGYDPLLPSGWTQLYNSGTATTIYGLLAYRVLTSGDITAGSVAVTCVGTYDGVAAIVTFVGSPTIQQCLGDQQEPESFTSDASLTTAATGSGYTALYFGSGRSDGNTPVATVSLGSSLQSANDLNFGACIYSSVLASSATVNPTFSFSANSALVDVVVIVETAPVVPPVPTQRGCIAYDQIKGTDRTGNGDQLLTWSTTAPAHSTSTGTPNQIAYDASGNLYWCFLANTWARIGPGGFSTSW
jgi:hypothetical protein